MKIGVTGGIGAGKSYVCGILRSWNYPVYDCDSEAKRIMVENPEVQNALMATVGQDAYTDDGQLNRAVVATYLFADKANVRKINAIVHPAVREDFQRWAEGKDLCFMESAILFESGFDTVVDKCVQVTAPLNVRVARAMQRDGASEESIRARIAAQMDEGEVGRRSHFVIVNDGNENLPMQLRSMLGELINERK